jgi:hypothetical protein
VPSPVAIPLPVPALKPLHPVLPAALVADVKGLAFKRCHELVSVGFLLEIEDNEALPVINTRQVTRPLRRAPAEDVSTSSLRFS